MLVNLATTSTSLTSTDTSTDTSLKTDINGLLMQLAAQPSNGSVFIDSFTGKENEQASTKEYQAYLAYEKQLKQKKEE